MAKKKKTKITKSQAYDWLLRARPDVLDFYGKQDRWKEQAKSRQGRYEIIQDWLNTSDDELAVNFGHNPIKAAESLGAGKGGHWTPEEALDYIWKNRPDVAEAAAKEGQPTATPEDKRRYVQRWLLSSGEPAVVNAKRNPFAVVMALSSGPGGTPVDVTTGGKGVEPERPEGEEPDVNVYQEMADYITDYKARNKREPSKEEFVAHLADLAAIKPEQAAALYDRGQSYFKRTGKWADEDMFNRLMDQVTEEDSPDKQRLDLDKARFAEAKRQYDTSLMASLSGPRDWIKYQQMKAGLPEGSLGGLSEYFERPPAFSGNWDKVPSWNDAWAQMQKVAPPYQGDVPSSRGFPGQNIGTGVPPEAQVPAHRKLGPMPQPQVLPHRELVDEAQAQPGGQPMPQQNWWRQMQAAQPYQVQPQQAAYAPQQAGYGAQAYSPAPYGGAAPPIDDVPIDPRVIEYNRRMNEEAAASERNKGARDWADYLARWGKGQPAYGEQPAQQGYGDDDAGGGGFDPNQGGWKYEKINWDDDTPKAQQSRLPAYFRTPTQMNAYQYYNMDPTQKQMTEGYWKDEMGWGDAGVQDAWAQIQRALPRSRANPTVRWR